MGQVSLVVGQAGTGKTTWLVEHVKQRAPGLLSLEHRGVLAITRMHGARRRVEFNLRESCPGVPCTVATIDGFALSILNRWRTTMGHSKPIQSVSSEADFSETIFGVEADFEKVRLAATGLLQNSTVMRIVGASYPLIVVDEFQDCHDSLLDFVRALSTCSTLVLAADEFQLLDTSTVGCPAVEWVRELKRDGKAEITELAICHRTSVQGVLAAAQYLRDEMQSNIVTVPVVCCPTEAPAAWKIIEKLVLSNNPWKGKTALICPSHDPFIQKVLDSCSRQLRKRNLTPIRWHIEGSVEREQEQIRTNLGLANSSSTTSSFWATPTIALDPIASNVVARSQRFARLRGMDNIPRALVERHVETIVHQKRAYRAHTPARTVTTVHGAKNREFDNVFVLWAYKLQPDQAQQRRLLYNAITRTKSNCMVLVLGDVSRANNDPVLSLLGPAQAAFPPKAKSPKSRSSKKVNMSLAARPEEINEEHGETD